MRPEGSDILIGAGYLVLADDSITYDMYHSAVRHYYKHKRE
jgi:hypothetical protein